MRALVLGATGTMGRRTCGELARSEAVDELVVAGRNYGAVTRLADLLGGRRNRSVRPAVLDIADAPTVTGAASQVDVVVSCAGPAYSCELPAARAVLAANTPYISLCDDIEPARELAGLDGAARAAEIAMVPGCGMSPGITNWLVDLAAEEFDVVEDIEISLAVSSVDARGAAARLHFLNAFNSDAPVVSEHQEAWEPSPGPAHLVYFPEPVGWVETFRCGHPEHLALTRRWPSLRTLQFRMGLTERSVMDATRTFIAAGITSTEKGRRLAARVAASALPTLRSLPPRGPAWTAVRVDVRGNKVDRYATVSLGVVDHLQNLASVPLALGAIDLGTGRVGEVGVLAPEIAFDFRTRLSQLSDRGIRMARLEGAPV